MFTQAHLLTALVGHDRPTGTGSSTLVHRLCTLLSSVAKGVAECVWPVVALVALSPTSSLTTVERTTLVTATFQHDEAPTVTQCLALAQQAVSMRNLDCATLALRVMAELGGGTLLAAVPDSQAHAPCTAHPPHLAAFGSFLEVAAACMDLWWRVGGDTRAAIVLATSLAELTVTALIEPRGPATRDAVRHVASEQVLNAQVLAFVLAVAFVPTVQARTGAVSDHLHARTCQAK